MSEIEKINRKPESKSFWRAVSKLEKYQIKRLLFLSTLLTLILLSGTKGWADEEISVVRFNFEEEVSDSPKGVNEEGKVTLDGSRRGRWTADHKVQGKQGFAYLFGGPEGKRYIQLQPEIGKDSFSISFWIKIINLQRSYVLCSTTSSPYWILEIRAEKFFFIFNAGSRTACLGARTKLEKDKWYHVVCSFNRKGKLKLFLNGKLDGEMSIEQHEKALKNFITIGGPYKYFQGLVDSFCIFKKNLSTAEVEQLYRNDIKKVNKEEKD